MSGRAPDRGPEGTAELDASRARIEALDGEILALVAERVRVAREIGRAKRQAGGAALDPGREAAVVRRAVERGRALRLPEEPVRDIFWTLIGLCRGVQVEDR